MRRGVFYKDNDGSNLLNKQAPRFLQLDGLRGVAALFVVLHHLLYKYSKEFAYSFKVPEFFNYGFFGVELFFLISGFVIFYSITKSTTIYQFLIKRVIRLYPVYWVCLLVTFISLKVLPLSEHRDTTVQEALLGLTMFNGLLKVKYVDPSYWSLLVEWWFYFLISLTILFHRFERKFYLFLLLWLGLIALHNFLLNIPKIGPLINVTYGPFFIAGICCYKIYVGKQASPKYFILLLLCMVCTLLTLEDLEGYQWGIPLVYVIFIASLHFKLPLLTWRPVLFLGEISYALYLIHQNFGYTLIYRLQKIGMQDFVAFLLATSASILLAVAVTRVFDTKISPSLKSWIAKKIP